MFERLIDKGFDVALLHHAQAIVQVDMPDAASDIEDALLSLEIPVTELVAGGGGEAPVTQRLRRTLADFGWSKRNITIGKTIQISKESEPIQVEAVSHEIDHVKSFGEGKWSAALETEWNNKDPFYDRDLENFKRLHTEGVISLGGLITRGASLQANMRGIIARFADDREINSFADLLPYGYDPTARQKRQITQRAEKLENFREAWVSWFVSDKYGEATTHWRKLQDRVARGVGNPCPLVLIGIPEAVVTFDYSAATEL
ncbi:MAG: restriction endonuclease [Hyphomicrobiaceae bacterium]|nr:restriction endonuclease [Hyphomicrobiaceae bacterium]MCC0024921.1 restriction endonuclease [Hyphomicrobiaceae bacterium]